MTRRAPLHGIKVLDLTRFLAGPYCTMLLGDAGADVLKVEPPQSGDPTRVQGPPFFDGEGLTFLATNRNKRSIVLDMRNPQDRELLKSIALKVDVLVENFRPGVLDRVGLDYATLSKENPGLIYASISGFGSTGPMAQEGAFDLTIQALGGYMSITGEPDQAPVKLGTSAFDMLAGMNLHSGILLALLERGKTGLGQRVETSLLESEVAFLCNAALQQLLGLGEPGRMGSEHPQLVPYRAFRTSDGWIVVGAGVQNLFERLARALDAEWLVTDPRSKDLPARLANRDFVNSSIENLTRNRTTNLLMEILTVADVPCSPVLGLADVFDHPQVLARQMVVKAGGDATGRGTTLGSAVKFSSFDPTSTWTPPPRLGEGGRELVDAWLGSKD